MNCWKADDHRWGKGHTHLIRSEGDTTLCGVKLTNCPGHLVPETEYDCRGCGAVVAAQKRRALIEEEWRIRNEESKRKADERNRFRQSVRAGTVMPFGKYKGMDLVDVPVHYLEWLVEQEWLFDDLRIEIESYLANC